jgi:hypothetical protein
MHAGPSGLIRLLDQDPRADRSGLFHLGPSGLSGFVRDQDPRPNGRGYYLPALRALKNVQSPRSKVQSPLAQP